MPKLRSGPRTYYKPRPSYEDYRLDRSYRDATSRAGFPEREARRVEEILRMDKFQGPMPYQPPAMSTPLPSTRTYRPDPRDHRTAVDHKTNAEKAFDQQLDMFQERFTINKILNRVLDAALLYGPAKPLGFTIEGLEAITAYFLNVHPSEANHESYPNYYLDGECTTPRGPPNTFVGGAWPSTNASTCLSGQAGTYYDTFESCRIGRADPTTIGHNHRYLLFGGVNYRYQHVLTYRRLPRQKTARVVPGEMSFHRGRNANSQRFANLTPQPLEAPLPVSTPVAVQQAVVVTVATGGARLPPQPPSSQKLRAARSTPPPKGTKELKSNAGKYGAAIARLLDRISEGSEVIDAIYKALPADVRKRWEKGRDLDRQGDQAGQYGISGADWKIQAIWHNVLKIDANKALQNILLNEFSDKLYGAAHKAKSDLTFRGRKRKRKPF